MTGLLGSTPSAGSHGSWAACVHQRQLKAPCSSLRTAVFGNQKCSWLTGSTDLLHRRYFRLKSVRQSPRHSYQISTVDAASVEDGLIGAVLQRFEDGRAGGVFARSRTPEAIPVDLSGLTESADWHRSSAAAMMMPPRTELDRAVMAQTAGNIAKLRSLKLNLRRPLDAVIGAGDFGENVWIENESMHAGSICVGDVFIALREAQPTGLVLEVASPRGPCTRIDAKHGATPGPEGVRAACAREGLGGFFFRVVSPGDIQEGDVLRLSRRPCPEWTLQKVSRALHGTWAEDGGSEQDDGQRIALQSLASLPELARFEWRDAAAAKLQQLEAGGVDDMVALPWVIGVITLAVAFLKSGVFNY